MDKDALTEVVSFRIGRNLLEQLDRMARKEMRTRGNLIMVLLDRSQKAKEVVGNHLEWLVKTLHEEEARNPDSPQAEYWRGELHAVKWMAALFLGEHEKAAILERIRRRTNLPIPHIVPLAPDGNRYGFDSDAG